MNNVEQVSEEQETEQQDSEKQGAEIPDESIVQSEIEKEKKLRCERIRRRMRNRLIVWP